MICRNKGDAIEGDKIFCYGRKIIDKGLMVKGRHRLQTAIVEARGREPAFCQIERTLMYDGLHKID